MKLETEKAPEGAFLITPGQIPLLAQNLNAGFYTTVLGTASRSVVGGNWFCLTVTDS